MAEKLSVEKEKVVREADFAKDLRADSLDLVELTIAVEDAFDITIAEEDREKLQTFGALVDYVTKRLRPQAA